MGHGNSDALYVRSSERFSAAPGAAATVNATAGHEALTFDHCALTFQPWEYPVAVGMPDGKTARIYELTNIVPYVMKYKTDPWSGEPLESNQLIPLHFHTNEKGAHADPVTYRAFGPHTRLVVVVPTGNVYAYDTVRELNLRARNLVDLVDQETPFDKHKDLWTLQDEQGAVKANEVPAHVAHHRTVTDADRAKYGGAASNSAQVNHSAAGGAAARLMASLREKAEPKPEPSSSPVTKPANKSTPQPVPNSVVPSTQTKQKPLTTGAAASSFTSSTLNPQTKNEQVGMTEEEELFDAVRALSQRGGKPARAYVRLETNLGKVDLELFVDKAPVTCWNFLQLCRSGYYTNTSFHRIIPGFMAQGGDPTGTGRGGQSYYGHLFGDELSAQGNTHKHTVRGTLSMANRGANTNSSQFFLTFRATPHLDNKHTVFGRIADQGGSERTLTAMERQPTSEDNRPLKPIVIEAADVYADPMQEQEEKLKARRLRNVKPAGNQDARDAARRKREADRTTWLGTNLDERHAAPVVAGQDGVGKYLATSLTDKPSSTVPALPRPSSKPKARPAHSFAEPSGGKKRKTGGGFGDFSSW